MEGSNMISLDTTRDLQIRLKEEIEFDEERLSKLEMRLNMASEELRQPIELLSILKNELKEGGSNAKE